MSRRLGILLLAAFVAVAGRAVCPRGMYSCFVFQEARHDCSGDGAALSARDCCCKGTQRLSEASGAADLRTEHTARALSAVSFAAILPDVERCPCGGAFLQLARGLGPPDTPISRHNTLLL